MDGAPSGSGCGSLPDPTPEKTITKSTSSELGGASSYRVSFAQMYRYGFDEVKELEGIMQPPMFLDNLEKTIALYLAKLSMTAGGFGDVKV